MAMEGLSQHRDCKPTLSLAELRHLWLWTGALCRGILRKGDCGTDLFPSVPRKLSLPAPGSHPDVLFV